MNLKGMVWFMIRINNLTKYFDDVCAVSHISLEIPDGIMFGLLGTNGAGKTTLLRMLAGIIEADAGKSGLTAKKIFFRRHAGKISFIFRMILIIFPMRPWM